VSNETILTLILQTIILGLFIPIMLQFIKSKLSKSINENLEKVKTEYAVSKLTYEHLVPLLPEFYSNLQRFYRICQNAQHCDVIKEELEIIDKSKKVSKDLNGIYYK
jgi:hypothetical protein